jgi:hypothetical protein
MVSEHLSRTGIVIGISKDVVPLSFHSEDEGTAILRNVGDSLPVDVG